jgi:hypothetical protein
LHRSGKKTWRHREDAAFSVDEPQSSNNQSQEGTRTEVRSLPGFFYFGAMSNANRLFVCSAMAVQLLWFIFSEPFGRAKQDN